MKRKQYIDNPRDKKTWKAFLEFTRCTCYKDIRLYLEQIEEISQEYVRNTGMVENQTFAFIGQWQAISGILDVLDNASEMVEAITSQEKAEYGRNR